MPLYHYTDLNAVISILETPTLRLTNLNYLNDSTELHDGVNVIQKILAAPHFTKTRSAEYLAPAIEYLNTHFGIGDYNIADYAQIFVASFSKSADQLSQWRGYGSYCIEFDEDYLKEYVSLSNCIYYDTEKHRIAREHVDEAIDFVKANIDNRSRGFLANPYDCLDSLLSLAATFKNKAFSEEMETRAILRSDQQKTETEYRVRGDLLIPYTSIPISLNCIKGVTIGPMANQALALKAFESYAEHHQEKWMNLANDEEFYFHVSASKIPYRAP